MDGRIPNRIDAHVGARIRLRRKVQGLSQQKLAEHLGLTFQQVQKYERGANRVSASMLYGIAEGLEVGVGFFFEGLAGTAVGEAGAGLDADLATLAANRGALDLLRAFQAIAPAHRRALVNVAHVMAQVAGEGVAIGHDSAELFLPSARPNKGAFRLDA